jgi:hypothetical protein
MLEKILLKWPWIPHVCHLVKINKSANNLNVIGKTNSIGYELYGIVGELDGQAIPLGFCFTASTSGNAAQGAKDRLLRSVIRYISDRCPNIEFTLSDKDLTEINGFRAEIPQARHQLCYWHAVTYIEERLAQDKPPASYSAIRAHEVFNFIDPTWVPGISSGWLEDGVHEDNADHPKPKDSEGNGRTNDGSEVSFNIPYR